MRITVDRRSDAVHLALTGGGGAATREMAEGIPAEDNAQGRLLGVEFGHGLFIEPIAGIEDAADGSAGGSGRSC